MFDWHNTYPWPRQPRPCTFVVQMHAVERGGARGHAQVRGEARAVRRVELTLQGRALRELVLARSRGRCCGPTCGCGRRRGRRRVRAAAVLVATREQLRDSRRDPTAALRRIGDARHNARLGNNVQVVVPTARQFCSAEEVHVRGAVAGLGEEREFLSADTPDAVVLAEQLAAREVEVGLGQNVYRDGLGVPYSARGSVSYRAAVREHAVRGATALAATASRASVSYLTAGPWQLEHRRASALH